MNEEMMPKYYQLKRRLIQKIDQEELKPEEAIPSERELIQIYGVSRITVRRALDELVNEGYLYKVQGKGTYVKSDEFNQDLIRITSCTEIIRKLGMKPGRRVLSAGVVPADGKRRHNLELGEDEEVFELKRIYYADGVAVNYAVTFLPDKLFPGLKSYDFSKASLYAVLEKKYHVRMTRAVRTIEAILAQDKTAEYLEIKEGTPVLLFCCVTYGIVGGRELPIENFKCCYRSDMFKFFINQTGPLYDQK